MGIQSLFTGLLIRSLLEILFIVLSPLAAGYYAKSENSEDKGMDLVQANIVWECDIPVSHEI
jgi:hypothetical protein